MSGGVFAVGAGQAAAEEIAGGQ